MKKLRLGILIAITAMSLYNQMYTENVIEQEDNTLVERDVHENALPLHAIILDHSLRTQQKIQQLTDLLEDENSFVDINAQDANGKTALNLATFYSADPSIIALLLQHNPKVNEPDMFNEMPLHNAIRKEEIEVARKLLAAGANPTLQNDSLQTPLDLARSNETRALLGLALYQ